MSTGSAGTASSDVSREWNRALDPRLLEILVCPRCKGELDYRREPESLLCHACELLYDVRDGIPTLLIDEARPLEAAKQG